MNLNNSSNNKVNKIKQIIIPINIKMNLMIIHKIIYHSSLKNNKNKSTMNQMILNKLIIQIQNTVV